MYGLMGSEPPIASRMPPTAETKPKIMLSTGTSTGELDTRRAAAAGVTSRASTRSAPMTCTETATASPRSTMKMKESRRPGTPRACATSGSRLSNVRGRQTMSSTTSTSTLIVMSSPSCGMSTLMIWPVSRPNLLPLRPG